MDLVAAGHLIAHGGSLLFHWAEYLLFQVSRTAKFEELG